MSVRGRTLFFLILSPHPSKTMLLLEAKKVTRSPCPHVISGGEESLVLLTTVYLWAALSPRRCKIEELGFLPFPSAWDLITTEVSHPQPPACCVSGMGSIRIIWPLKSGCGGPRTSMALGWLEDCGEFWRTGPFFILWGGATVEDYRDR